MSREAQELVASVTVFIVGALARSIVGGLGHKQPAALLGLVSLLALLYLGFRNLLWPNPKDRSSQILQRGTGLLVVVISLAFCLPLLRELFS